MTSSSSDNERSEADPRIENARPQGRGFCFGARGLDRPRRIGYLWSSRTTVAVMKLIAFWAGVALCLAGCGDRAVAPAPVIQFQTTSTAQVEQGRRLSAVLGCGGCHGADLAGEDWSDPGYGRLWTANLTRAAAGYSDAELDRVIRGGRRSDRDLWGMPSHLFTHLSGADMAAVIAYIRSKPVTGVSHPGPTFGDLARREIAAGIWMSSAAQVAKEGEVWPPDAGEAHALGRYIVRATCAECHGVDLRGGDAPPGKTPPPDLMLVGAYEPQQFKELMRTGVPIGGRDLGLMGEVARGRFSLFTDAEVDAVYAYLKRVAGSRSAPDRDSTTVPRSG